MRTPDAIHRGSGRLYGLRHQGPPEPRQEPGTEAWVFDLQRRERVARIELEEQSVALGVSQGDSPTLYSVDFFVPMPTLA